MHVRLTPQEMAELLEANDPGCVLRLRTDDVAKVKRIVEAWLELSEKPVLILEFDDPAKPPPPE